MGLDSGTEYLVKPFAFAELLGPHSALLVGRAPAGFVQTNAADLNVDLVTRRVSREAHPSNSRHREFELLEYLLRHEEEVVLRDILLARDVWRENSRSTTLNNVIDVHIARLRRKIDLKNSEIKLIHTVRSILSKTGP